MSPQGSSKEWNGLQTAQAAGSNGKHAENMQTTAGAGSGDDPSKHPARHDLLHSDEDYSWAKQHWERKPGVNLRLHPDWEFSMTTIKVSVRRLQLGYQCMSSRLHCGRRPISHPC